LQDVDQTIAEYVANQLTDTVKRVVEELIQRRTQIDALFPLKYAEPFR
jgi:hypothetical protein